MATSPSDYYYLPNVWGWPSADLSAPAPAAAPAAARTPDYTPKPVLDRTATNVQTREVTTTADNEIVPIVYGRSDVGGRVFAVAVHDSQLVLGVLWCVGECEEVESVLINGSVITAGITRTDYLGTTAQTADTTLASAISGYTDRMVTSVAGEDVGLCYSVFRINPGAVNGFPRMVGIIKGRKVNDTRELCERSYYQGQPDVATFRRIAWTAGDVVYAALEDGTDIYKNGTYVTTVGAYDTGTLTVASGDEIRTCHRNPMTFQYQGPGTINLTPAGANLMTPAYAGRIFGCGNNRYLPWQFRFYNDSETDHASVTVSYATGFNVNRAWPTDNVVTTFSMAPQEFKTYEEDWVETSTYTSAHTVYIKSTGDIMVHRLGRNGTGDFMQLVPMGSNAINPIRAATLTLVYATTESGTYIDSTQSYWSAGTTGIFSLHQHADGAGGDGTPWLPTTALADRYLIHPVDGYLCDYAIACINQCTVEVFDKTGMKVWQHNFPTASRTSAGVSRPGLQSGSGEDRTNLIGATEDFTSDAWVHTGTVWSAENDNIVPAPRPGYFMTRLFCLGEPTGGSYPFAQQAKNGPTTSHGSTVVSGLYSALIWLRAGTYNRASFGIYCSAGVSPYPWPKGRGEIIYGPGTLFQSVYLGEEIALGHISDLSPDEPTLVRVSMTSVFNTPAGSLVGFYLYPGGTEVNTAGQSIYAWGAHLEDIHELPVGYHPYGYAEVSGGTYGYIPNASETEVTTRNWLVDTPAYFSGSSPFYLRSNAPKTQDEFIAEGWLTANTDKYREDLSYKNAEYFKTRWTKNPALITADYLSSKVFGANRDLSIYSVSSTADFCSAIVEGANVARWQMGLTLDRPARVADWVDTLRAYGNFFIYSYASLLEFHPDTVEDTTNLTLYDENDIIDGTMQLRKKGVLKSPTVVRVNYTHTDTTQWKDHYALAQAPGVVTGAAPWIESVVRMPGIQSYQQANRQAIQRLNRLHLSDLELSFETFDAGIFEHRGGLIKVTHPYGLENKIMRVTGVENTRPGRWRVQCVEYQPNIYSNLVEAEPELPDTPLPGPWDLPIPGDVVLAEELYQLVNGEWASRIRVTWNAVTYYYPFVYDVRVFRDGSDQLVWSGTTSTLKYVTGSVQEGVTYSVHVRIVNSVGVQGPYYTLPELLQNLFPYSEQADHAAWGKVGCTVTANVTLAPDGNLTADKLIADTTGGSHYIVDNIGNQSGFITFSFYAKAAEYQYVCPYLYATDGTTASTIYYFVNLSTGTVSHTGNTSAGSTWWSNASYDIESAGNGWYRCSLTAYCDPQTTTVSPCLIMSATGDSIGFIGDGTSSIYVWGMQAELRDHAGEYVKTTGSAITLTNPPNTPPSITVQGKQLRPGDVPNFMGDEIGGRVRLWWDPAIDIDIRNYEIRYGTIVQEWEAATRIDRTDALRYETSVVPEGVWRFFIKAIDSLGQYSVNAATVDIRVTTDTSAFSEYYDYTSYTEVSVLESYRLSRTDDVNRWITEDNVVWNTKYTSNLDTYIKPLACYHNATPSKFTSEVWDIGYDITGNFIGEIVSSCPAGGPVAKELWTQASGGSYVTTADPMSVKTTARYVKLNTYASANATLKVFQPVFRTRLVSTPRLENGFASSTAGTAYEVKLANQYVQAKSINITPMNVASARTAVVDNVVLDSFATCSFDVWIFDEANNSVANDFTWEFYGV